MCLEKDGYLVKRDVSLTAIAEFLGMRQSALSMHVKRHKQPEYDWMPYKGYIIHWRIVDLPMIDEYIKPACKNVRNGHVKGSPLLVGHETYRIH